MAGAAIFVATATLAAGAFPPADIVEKLVRAAEPLKDNEITAVTTSAFVEGETPAQALAAVRIKTEYFEDIYPALFVRQDGAWKLAALGEPVIFVEAMGGDEGTFIKTAAGDKDYYIFSASEKSYGTGMGTETDYFVVFDPAGGELKEVFEGVTRDYTEVFSRWYGGEDSTAWQGGGADLTETTYTFADMDGDGVWELWACARESIDDGEPARLSAVLYAPGQDGVFAEAEEDNYRAAVENRPSAIGYLWLGGRALEREGDVKNALAYYRKAAAADAGVGGDLTGTMATAERWAADPPDAIRLFFADKGRDVIDKYFEAEIAADAVFVEGDLPDYLKFLEKKPAHPRWAEAYHTAAALMLFDTASPAEGQPPADQKELDTLRKKLDRYLKLETEDRNKAEALTWLADAYFTLGQYKQARPLYKEALAWKAESPFEDYDFMKLGDCEAALGNNTAALEAYIAAVAIGGWWSYQAENNLLSFAAVELGGLRRNFAEYLEATLPDGESYVTTGDLDGNPGDDLAVVVQTGDRRDYLFYFLRRGDEFMGAMLIGSREAGGPGALLLPEVRTAGSFRLLIVEEVVEDDAGRTVYKRLYRYDGHNLREVARIEVGASRSADPSYEYRAELRFAGGEFPVLSVPGSIKKDGVETAATEEYKWNPEAFAFERAHP